MATANTSETVDVRENIIAVGQRLIGAKGFSAVGLNEILSEAGVPKGSFYHYFGSKDAFGVAMLESYFEEYLDDLDQTLAQPGLNMAQRLMNYWRIWQETQSFFDCQGKCLAVKLGAEVADMSEAAASLGRGDADRLLAEAVVKIVDATDTGGSADAEEPDNAG